ncbi:Mitotic checkpoint protein BUB3.2 [Sesamum angolense]|uniref:Mitotic checkpoint protein BUB3.2 n=1 Tax=Sesamum angolense TaxID=2727404 RepID=A0AAE1X4M7_9LAMI|nr:Mitotic checkpoint protein BUB3.2 [Sesamum angolense]
MTAPPPPSTGRELSSPPTDGISNLRFSNHSDHLLVSSWDKSVRLYDASANALRGEFMHGGPVLDCCFHDDSSGFSACADHTACSTTIGKMFWGDMMHPVRCVEYSYGTGQVITGSWDKTLKCWDPRGASGYALSSVEGRVAMEFFDLSEAGQSKKYAFKCHRKSEAGRDIVYPVNAIAFHPIYGTFATGGCDGYVNVWDGNNKKRLYQYTKYQQALQLCRLAEMVDYWLWHRVIHMKREIKSSDLMNRRVISGLPGLDQIATKLYCFVHKVPVCGECICFPEHQICVVRTYSEWVIDGEYDWPPKCCQCQAALAEGTDPQTTRLGCLHVIHTNCLVSHIKSFPPHTAPAGYVCPTCSTSIWPPKSVRDSGSRLHSKLREAIMQTGLEKNLFGNHPVPLHGTESRSPPPAFASEPLIQASAAGGGEYHGGNFPLGKDSASTARPVDLGIVEIDEPSSATSSLPNHDSNFMKSASPAGGPGATTRKSAVQVERQNSEASYYADDEDGNRKKYSRRGTFRHKFLRSLLPFWSSALPTLPVTAPPQKDVSHADDAPEGRVWQQWVFCITELRNAVWEMIWVVKGYRDQWYYDMHGAAG